MTAPHGLPPRDERPLVIGTLARAALAGAGFVRGALVRAPRQLLMMIWAGGTLAIFAAVVLMSVRQSPDAAGVMSGIAGGFFVALLFAGAMAWLLMWISRAPAVEADVETAQVSELEGLLAPELKALESARADVRRQVSTRSKVRVPAGIAATLLIWFLAQWNSEPPGVVELIIWPVVGAVLGEIWAIGQLSADYTRLYKQRVLPQLARRLGDLTYREASAANAGTAHLRRIIKTFDTVKADDEIAGTYRGLPVAIVEARFEHGSGDDRRVVLDGLLVNLTLPRNLSGTTIVAPDDGLVGNLVAEWRSDGLERVSLEDPRFEKKYEVYGTDQIEARALLTPAFMERFMDLAGLAGLAAPGCVAEGNRLMTVLPKRLARDLFEPPPYWQPAGGRALLELSADIKAVLAMVDAVIDLDFWASSAGRDRSGRGAPPAADGRPVS